MKVTSVEPQKKSASRRTKRFNIFLDGQFAFGADEDLVVDYRLVVGKNIEAGDLEKILFDAEVGKLMERVYGLSSFRMRSEKEIRDFLKRLSFKRKLKGGEEISPIVIESTIDRAIKKGLISDLAFAKAWIDSRSKKYGINRIKQELFQKGIDREVVEEVIEGLSSENVEQTAEKVLEKKIKVWKNLSKLEFRKKATDYLMRRGFEYPLIKTVIDNFLQKYNKQELEIFSEKNYNTNSSSEDTEGENDDF
jgi:regulatory protein